MSEITFTKNNQVIVKTVYKGEDQYWQLLLDDNYFNTFGLLSTYGSPNFHKWEEFKEKLSKSTVNDIYGISLSIDNPETPVENRNQYKGYNGEGFVVNGKEYSEVNVRPYKHGEKLELYYTNNYSNTSPLTDSAKKHFAKEFSEQLIPAFNEDILNFLKEACYQDGKNRVEQLIEEQKNQIDSITEYFSKQ